MSKSEKLKNLLYSWGDLVDTSDSDDDGHFWLGWNVDISDLFSLSLSGDVQTVGISVLSGVSCCSLKFNFNYSFGIPCGIHNILLFKIVIFEAFSVEMINKFCMF